MSNGYEQYLAQMKGLGWPAMTEEEWLASLPDAQPVSDGPPEWDGTQRAGQENSSVRRAPDHATYDANGNERAGQEHAHAPRRPRKFMSPKGDDSAYGEDGSS